MADLLTEEEFLLSCAETIERGDLDLLLQFLETMDLDNVKLSEARALFYYLLVVCFDAARSEMVAQISEHFARILVQGAAMEVYVFSEPAANPEVLSFYYRYNGRDLTYYMDFLFLLPQEPDVQQCFALLTGLEEVRNALTYDQVQGLLTRLYALPEEKTPQGEVVEEALKRLAASVAPEVEKPTYILDARDFGLVARQELITQAELQALLPVRPADLGIASNRSSSQAERIRVIARSMAQEAYEAGEIMMSQIAIRAQAIEESTEQMDYEEFNEFFETYEIKQWERSLQDDPHLLRILGPCHPQTGEYDLDSESSDPCRRFGGCRMLTCVHHEYEDDEEMLRFTDPELVEWFTGHCDRCSKIINQKHFAVRVALEYGGFKGCYCSEKHALKDCIDNGLPVARQLTEAIFSQLRTTGIYHRDWEEKKPNRATRQVQIEEGLRLIAFMRDNPLPLSTLDYAEPDLAPVIIG